MPLRHLVPLLFATVLAAPAGAQPLSRSMAECAALYRVSSHWMSRSGRADSLVAAARAWNQAAVEEARSEGRTSPEAFADLHEAEKFVEWERRGFGSIMSEDFRDWASYCQSLAEHREIDIDITGPKPAS